MSLYYLPIPTDMAKVLEAAKPASVVKSDTTGIYFLVMNEAPSAELLFAIVQKAGLNGKMIQLSADKYQVEGWTVSGLGEACLLVLKQAATAEWMTEEYTPKVKEARVDLNMDRMNRRPTSEMAFLHPGNS